MTDLVKRLRIKAGMIEMGEMIAWGSDSALMREAADELEMAAPAVQGEPVAWALPDPDPTDSRPFLVLFHSTSQVNDPSSLVPLYTAPQPAEQQPDAAQLVEAAQALADACRRKIYPQPDKPDSAWAKLKDLDAALAAYRKGGE